MKNKISKIPIAISFIAVVLFSSCEKDLQPDVYDQFTPSSFFKDANDAKAALTSVYTGLRSVWSSGYGSMAESWNIQNDMTSDVFVCSWGWPGFKQMNDLNFTETLGALTMHYSALLKKVSEATILIEKLNAVPMDETLKKRFIAEAKALRAHYSQVLYGYYGPVSIVIDPAVAQDPKAEPAARPTKEWMVNQIEKDYKDALAALPDSYPSSDYGKFTKGAGLMGLMKLYMQEKKWSDAVTVGQQIKGLGYQLQSTYADIFTITNEQNKELILAIPSIANDWGQSNIWLPHVLPVDYYHPTGQALEGWEGFKVPWKTYDKFDPADKRLSVLLRSYPTGKDGGGNLIYRDGKTTGVIGAIPIKYGPDPSNGTLSGTDIVVLRYADAMLLLAEAINEVSGPTTEAYGLVNDVRQRAGLSPLAAGLSKDQFRDKLMDERLFELWGEGVRRDDLIRWGKYIQRAKDEGSPFADDNKLLYPLPRVAVDESKGKITQNPGY